MSTPLANPRRTKLVSWPEPRKVAPESDQIGKPTVSSQTMPDADLTGTTR